MLTKRHVRNVTGLAVFFGHLACVGLIIYKWKSIDGLLNLGAPIMPVAAYALASIIRFSSGNKLYKDDADRALLLFSVVSISLPVFVAAANIVVIMAVDTSLLGTGFTVTKGREVITWLEATLGAGYAFVVEGLFNPRAADA